MQEKSKTFQSYSDRTDALARELRINVSDLPQKIEVSASMFHSYRSGKYPISEKAWRKLEAAEAAAGIKKEKGFNVSRETLKKGLPEAGNAESCGNPKESEMGAEKIPELLRRIADALEEIARKLPPLE